MAVDDWFCGLAKVWEGDYDKFLERLRPFRSGDQPRTSYLTTRDDIGLSPSSQRVTHPPVSALPLDETLLIDVCRFMDGLPDDRPVTIDDIHGTRWESCPSDKVANVES